MSEEQKTYRVVHYYVAWPAFDKHDIVASGLTREEAEALVKKSNLDLSDERWEIEPETDYKIVIKETG